MLIFKNNIYSNRPGQEALASLIPGLSPKLDIYKFVKISLNEEMDVIGFLDRQPNPYQNQDMKSFYPYAYKSGNPKTFRKLIRILLDGLDCRRHWYYMNTYHFCFLHDVLRRNAFNYNHDSAEEMLRAHPELEGKPIDFEIFLKNYFFNTVFLLDEDQYNALSSEEKKRKGFTCTCQFGVINGLTPHPDEMELKVSENYPYSVYV